MNIALHTATMIASHTARMAAANSQRMHQQMMQNTIRRNNQTKHNED